MKKITMTGNKECWVDDDKYDSLSQFKWCCVARGYAGTRLGKTIITMHRLLLGFPKNKEVDHIDGNRLNNQMSNLRVCSKTENRRNKSRYRNNEAGMKGVSRTKNTKHPYVARIFVQGKSIYLGYFGNPQEAGLAYNEAALRYFGEFSRLNEVPNV